MITCRTNYVKNQKTFIIWKALSNKSCLESWSQQYAIFIFLLIGPLRGPLINSSFLNISKTLNRKSLQWQPFLVIANRRDWSFTFGVKTGQKFFFKDIVLTVNVQLWISVYCFHAHTEVYRWLYYARTLITPLYTHVLCRFVTHDSTRRPISLNVLILV